MITKQDKNQVRKKRHARVRSKISGTAQRPRLNVFRSNKNIYAQLIEKMVSKVLVAMLTQQLKSVKQSQNALRKKILLL